MNSILQNQKPVEFFSAERIKIEIDGQQILWRDMTLKIDSRIGEHTVGKIKYIASLQQISNYQISLQTIRIPILNMYMIRSTCLTMLQVNIPIL